MNILYKCRILICITAILIFNSCYSTKWAESGKHSELQSAPASIKEIFGGDSKLVMSCLAPGLKYQYDIAEKDEFYDSESRELIFTYPLMRLYPPSVDGSKFTRLRAVEGF